MPTWKSGRELALAGDPEGALPGQGLHQHRLAVVNMPSGTQYKHGVHLLLW